MGAGMGLVSVPRSLISSGHLLTTNHIYTLQLRLFNPNKIEQLQAASTDKSLYGTWLAPLFNFDFSRAGWYCNAGELNYLNQLPANVKCEQVQASVQMGTVNSPFNTAAAGSTQLSTNSHVNIIGYQAESLESHTLCYPISGDIAFSTASGEYVMSGCKKDHLDLAELLHNFAFTGTDFTKYTKLPASQVVRGYNQVTGFPTYTGAAVADGVGPYRPPEYRRHCTMFNLTTADGTLYSMKRKPNLYANTQTFGYDYLAKQKSKLPADIDMLVSMDDAAALSISNLQCEKLEAKTAAKMLGFQTCIQDKNTVVLNGSHMNHERTIPMYYLGYVPPTTTDGSKVQAVTINLVVETSSSWSHAVDMEYGNSIPKTTLPGAFNVPTAHSGFARLPKKRDIDTASRWAGVPIAYPDVKLA